MQLRANVRRPGRYREDEVEDLPPNPRFVVPTIAFNPDLRPAVFPTLQWNELSPDHPAYVAKEQDLEDNSGEGESSENAISGERPKERPALVFRDNRTLPVMETEEGLIQLEDGTWVATENEGEYDAFAGMWADDDIGGETEDRWFPPALREQRYWSELSNGMRLVLVRELTAQMFFYDIALFLELGEKELDDFFNLCKEEIRIREVEDARVARTHERQMAMLDSPDWNLNGDDWGRILDEEAARMGETKMPSTFLVTREEVAVAKNYLRNFRFREEYPETADENFDEVNHIPPFSILSSIMDRLDLYIGVDTTFKELDFEQDFLEYLPEDVIVMEEAYEDGEIVESVVEVPPHHEPVATTRHVQAHPVTPTAMSTPASPSKPPKEKSTTKKSTKNDNLTGTDVVSLNLTKKPRGRPPKKDKIAKAGPTRLREVMNADDIAPPSQSPSSTPAQDIAPTITIDPAQATPQRPATPPSSRNVSAVARNPFKDHSPSTPPPVHCASFRDDLPAQPAPTSPPKASTVSPPRTMSDSNVAAGVQPYYKVRTDATEAQDHYVSPANSMAVSVSSMSKGPSTSSNSPLAVYQTGIRSMPQANLLDHPMSYVIFDEGFTAQTPQSVESTMRTMDQSANSLPPKIASASSSTTGALAAQEMARSALDMTAVSKTKPQSAASAPSSKVGIPPSIAQTTMGQVPASNQPSPANSPSASTSKFIATPKNVPPANAPTQFNKQITQGKLKFNTKGSQGSPAPNPAPNQAHNSVSTSSEASSGKRTRDEEAGADIPEGQAAKKPRLEQQGHPKNSFIDKVKGDMRAMSNMLTSGKDAAVKASPIHSSDTLKDSKEGSTTQPATPTAAVLVNQPEEVDKSDEESMIHVAEVTLGVFTHPESSSDLQDLSMADNTTTPNLTNQPSMAENVATETSMTPTNASGSTPNLPAKSKKATGYKEEAARAAGQALLQQVATQATEAGDESKILETPPSILAEKTRSAARHARTTSQSSTESIENSRAKRAKTFTPEPIMSVGPALLQNVTSEGSSESKKLGAPPPTLAEKTRSAARHTRTNSQSSINSISTKQARTSTPEPSMTESPAQRRSSKLEVQIPTSKRAASELLGPTFDREESPAKKLKTREASSTTPANGATQAKIRPQKKTTNAKVTKKPAPKAKANSQSEATPQDGEASSSSSAAGATLAADPTPQVKPGSKKGSNGKKTTTPAKASAPPKAPPQPKAAPKSKAPAQPTSTPKPSATKGVTAKPKATPKAKSEKGKPSGTNKKGVGRDDQADG